LSYEERQLADIDLSDGLPGWPHTGPERFAHIQSFRRMTEQELWENFAYFLKRVVPVAEHSNVRLAIHPDDPPWSISGLPRIMTSEAALQRVLDIVDSPANGLTLCSGSLGANPANDVPGMVRRFGRRGRIHFAHCRNVKITGDRTFHESAHPSGSGSLAMAEIMQAYHEIGFDGPMRPDHGRMIWGEVGQPGYGLYDRALGAMYLSGLWEGIQVGG
jgi:mannonate dehydratase